MNLKSQIKTRAEFRSIRWNISSAILQTKFELENLKCKSRKFRVRLQIVANFLRVHFARNTNENAKVIENLAEIQNGIFTRKNLFAEIHFARIHFLDTEIEKFRLKFADTKSRTKETKNFSGIAKIISRFANLAIHFNARSLNADLEIAKQKRTQKIIHSETKAKNFRQTFAFRFPFKINNLIWWNFAAEIFQKVGRRVEIFTKNGLRRPPALTTKIREYGNGLYFQRFAGAL